MSDAPHLEVTLLGGFSLTIDDQLQTVINQPQQQSLLAYLILHTHTPQLRRQIAFLFWHDSSEVRAYANLRRALHKLRIDCPTIDYFLVSTAITLSWQRPTEFTLDVLTYESLLKEAAATTDRAHICCLFKQAVSWYRGELLPGCYDEWLLTERERLNQQQLHLLHQLTDLLATEGNYTAAIKNATELRSRDPFREQSYRLLMTLHEASGDRAAALRTYHDCVAMLERELGVGPGSETQAIYRRLLNRSASSLASEPLLIRRSVAIGPKLVGREVEWQHLLHVWQQAREGQPQLTLIQGEAGIGKTHLAETLLTWARQHNQLAIRTRVYAAEGQLSYSLVVEWLRTGPYATLVTDLADIWLAECSRLLPELLAARPNLVSPPPLTDSGQRLRLFEALARAVLSPRRPLLVLLDDLQWADQDTLEWLHFLLRFDPTAPLLLVGTVRNSEVTATHWLTNLQQGLHREGRIQEIHLVPLTAAASNELAQQTAGIQLTPETLTRLHNYAEGVPLFLVEAVRAEIEKAESERWRWSTKTPIAASNTLPLPPKIYAVIQARLNLLSPGARQVVNAAAVIGRAFSLALLTLSTQSDEQSLLRDLDELWQRRIVREQGSRYDLSHDRIRDVVYAELSPIQRKVLHHRAAEALLRRHGANLEVVSAQLAYHYEVAGLCAEAVDYYLQAGEAAQRVYANDQAGALLKRGITLIETLPTTPQRDQQRLDLYASLAAALLVTKGWTSIELYDAAYAAWQLSEKLHNPRQRFRLINSLNVHYLARGDLDRAHQFAMRALAVSEQEQSADFFVLAHRGQAATHFCRGTLRLAHEFFKKSLSVYDLHQHVTHHFLGTADHGLISYVWGAHTLWLLGYPDQALSQCREGVRLAQALNHPFNEALTLAYLSMLYQFRQEREQVHLTAEACLAITQVYNIGFYHRWANTLLAWARALKNPTQNGLTELQTALTEYQADGAGLRLPFYLSLQTLFYEKTDNAKAGLETIDKAFASAAQYNEDWWNAELYRLRGNLLYLQGAVEDKVEMAYQQAISLAREQEALSLELRATTSLARLWQKQARKAQAHDLLSAVYRQFTEGFGTPDLQEAQALLDNLSK